MISALRVAGSGLTAQQTALDVISHNLANVNTPGFKRSRVNFEDVGVPQESAAPATAPIGRGVMVRDIQRIETAGAFESTGLPFDLAIAGAGFFVVTRPDGSAGYTHDGSFRLTAAGTLVNSSGDTLAGVQIPAGASSVSIARDGTVIAQVNGESQLAGRIGVAVFPNPAGLEAAGGGIFLPTPASGEPAVVAPGTGGAGEIVAGVREMANISIGDEMVALLIARRAYSASARSVQAVDEMLQQATTLNA
ncbi:MAG: flagellar hook-basal body complex protein [Chloroflexota bacterium]|nr:flagellar hook-basal body complex protein [Dehalococcoidia bacterium]MDW8254880.1 flagellar hook-basal body complex protein [Chloroflexota bacterium]